MSDEGRPVRDETTDAFAERLVATLESRAGTVDDGPRFGAADVVRAGNQRIRRRRRALAAGAAAAVVAAVLTGSLVTRPTALPPSRPASNQPAPNQPAPNQPAPNQPEPNRPAPLESAAGARLDLLAGNTVYRADGTTVALGLGGGRAAKEAVRVHWGWIVTAEPAPDAIREVWFVPDHGTARSVGKVFGGLAVSPDNRVLVVAHDSTRVAAYELPSLREIGRRTFEEGMGPVVLGATDDVALLEGGAGDGTPTRGAVWGFHTGAFTITPSDFPAWGMSDDGRVLRKAGDCVDVVPVTVTLPQGHAGWCGAQGAAAVQGGDVSPDGGWVSLDVGSADAGTGSTTVLVRTSDLSAGRWRPIPTGGPAGAELSWLTGDAFVLETPEGGRWWCRAADRCRPVAEPPGLTAPVTVMFRGLG
ncbi:hypothetical protein [Krasilnikovia sp. MM14-A1004]|uniref:hypothetical protein n=1 Tax=Krasilnikovia sp. MM14-A1004 TaxID=3373541 RepID=UPI00399C6885